MKSLELNTLGTLSDLSALLESSPAFALVEHARPADDPHAFRLSNLSKNEPAILLSQSRAMMCSRYSSQRHPWQRKVSLGIKGKELVTSTPRDWSKHHFPKYSSLIGCFEPHFVDNVRYSTKTSLMSAMFSYCTSKVL